MLFDAGRVDAAVHHQLVEGQAGHFAADRVEGGKQDGVRGIVHDDFYAGSGFQGADVATFAADDAAFDFIALDGEGGNGVFDGGFGSGTLDGVDNDAFRFLGGVQTGLVHHIVDVSLRLGAGLGLHVLYEHVLRLGGCHAGNGFQLFVGLGTQTLEFFGLAAEVFLLGLEAVLQIFGVAELFLEVGILLAQGALFLFDPVFGLAQLVVLFVYMLFVLGFELEVFLLGLQDPFLFNLFPFRFGGAENFLFLAFQQQLPDHYVDSQRDDCADDGSYQIL